MALASLAKLQPLSGLSSGTATSARRVDALHGGRKKQDAFETKAARNAANSYTTNLGLFLTIKPPSARRGHGSMRVLPCYGPSFDRDGGGLESSVYHLALFFRSAKTHRVAQPTDRGDDEIGRLHTHSDRCLLFEHAGER